MNENAGFLAGRIPVTDRDDSLFHVIPVPFDRDSADDGGTVSGPAAILDASRQIEPYDGHTVPSDPGIHTCPPIDCAQPVERVIASIEKAVDDSLDMGSIPILLGGEHTVSIGAFQAIRKRFDTVGIIQFDAHADLHPSRNGSVYDRSCVMSHALELDIPFLQIGVRSVSKHEIELRHQRDVWYFDALSIALKGIDRVFVPDDFPELVYVTIDVDVFDSTVMPATKTPEPGGLNWYEALALMTFVSDNCKVIGFDAVELAPIPGFRSPNYTVARFIHECMGMVVR